MTTRLTTFRLHVFGSLTAVLALFLLTRPLHAIEIEWEMQFVDTAFESARSVATLDLDGDGDLDLLATNDPFPGTDDSVSWWENTAGDGSSWVRHEISVLFNGAISAVGSDIDGDGDLDVVAAGFAANSIRWWENATGDASSWVERAIDNGFDGANWVASADMDGDGDADVLGAAINDQEITWWENTAGNGTSWTARAIATGLSSAHSVAAADVDGDGDIDVLGTNDPLLNDTDGVRWWENIDGAGTTWFERTIANPLSGASSVVAADIDGDGDLDAIASGTAADAIRWWDNVDGNGAVWIERSIVEGLDFAESVHAADVDGDGDLDVLGAASRADSVTWWENLDGIGQSWTERLLDGAIDGAFAVVSGDLDGDGDLDVLASASDADGLVWWDNRTLHRSALFPTRSEIATPAEQAHGIAAADLDGDGDLDGVVASEDDDTVAWYENDGADPPGFIERVISTSVDDAQAVATSDIDGDGRIDVLTASSADDTIRLFTNAGGDPLGFVEQIVSDTAAGAFSVASADLDGDGDADVLSASRADDTVRWFENDGASPPAFTERILTTTADSARSVAAADLDDDGDVDVLAASRDDDTVRWFENDGGSPPLFTEHLITTSADGARSVVAANINGDRRIDVVVASELDDSVRVFANTGGDPLVFVEQVIGSSVDGALAVSAVDADLDGDLDVLAASRDDDTLRWFENDGNLPPTFSERIIATDATFAQAVVAGDFDGDGDPDTLASTLLDYKLAWYENCGGQFALRTTDTAPFELLEGTSDDLLAIEVQHNGRDGDGDLGLLTFELLFEEAAGDPLTTIEANALVAALQIYLDDGSGVFEEGVDLLVGQELFLELVEGGYTFVAGSGNSDFRVPAATSATYFVVTELTADAASQSPNQFRITHLTEAGGPQSAAEASDVALPLALECAENVSSSVLTADTGGTTLVVGGTCPGEITIQLTGAQPNAAVTFLSSDAEGVFVKPQPPCQGLEIGLATPSVVTSVTTNANGNALLTPNVNAGACGLFLQAVESAICAVSNVDQLP